MFNFTKNIKMKTLKKIALLVFLLMNITINAQNNIDTTKFKNYCNRERCKDYNDKYHFNPYYNHHLCENFNPEQIDFSNEYYNLQTKIHHNDKNLLNKFLKYDLSKIWLSRNLEQNGVLGADYERIHFYIDTVYKSNKDNKTYIVIGKSKVKDNICDFKGEIKIISFFNNIYSEASTKFKRGDLFASYIFYEDSTKYHSGIFEGITQCYIYIDENNKKVNLDNSFWGVNKYRNRSFVGIWKIYSNKLKMKCIWGDGILPFTFDFYLNDNSVGINKKYFVNGWQTSRDEDEYIKITSWVWETKDKWWLKK